MSPSLTPLPVPELLSPGVTGVAASYPLPEREVATDLTGDLDLPQELARAAALRKVEFWAGRQCARQALEALGFSGEADLAIGEGQRPVWPAGFLGSITHGQGFAWAAVASTDQLQGLGIDSEPVLSGNLLEEVREQVASPAELETLGGTGLEHATGVTALFGAKECLFKCLYPHCGTFFDFPDASVPEWHLEPGGGRFLIRLETELTEVLTRGFALEGRFLLDGDRVHTALEWPT